jgi:hypothetical protein
MAVRMVESLRLFGGRLSDAPVIAITARLGPPLAPETLARFDELGITYIRRRHLARSWNRFIGKVRGLEEIDHLASTGTLALVDCDLLFLAEPTELILPSGVDVAACHPDNGIVGSTGPDSPFEPSWRLACEAVGLDVEALPWVSPWDGSDPVRFYVNSGVVVLRRGSGLPQEWHRCVDALLDHHVLFPGWGDYFADQVALGLAILRSGLVWRPLPLSHNYGVANTLPLAWHSPELAEARILHYHDQLWPKHWDDSLVYLRQAHPEVTEWLEPQGPILDTVTRSGAAIRYALRIPRALTRRLHRFRGWLSGRRPLRDE